MDERVLENFQWNANNFPLTLLGDIYSEEDPFSWWKKEEEKQPLNGIQEIENKNPELDELQEFNEYFPVQFTQQQQTFFFSPNTEEKRSPNFNATPFSKKQHNFEENHLTDFMNSLSFNNKGIQKTNKRKPKKTATNPKEKKISFFHYKWQLKQFQIKNKGSPP